MTVLLWKVVFPVTVTDGKIEFAFEMGKILCLNSIDAKDIEAEEEEVPLSQNVIRV